MEARLTGPTDLAGFRSQARQFLARQVAPGDIEWQLDPQAADPSSPPPSPLASRPRNVAKAAIAIVPASFTRLCELVVLHRDPSRFALLYQLLWRLVHEPGLRHDPLDTDMLLAQHMAHAVRRDIHKMKANLRLRPVRGDQGEEMQLGCHEPAHHVLEAVAPWLARRMTAPRWAVFTPGRSVRCEQGLLVYGPALPLGSLPGPDAGDAEWLACYRRVFATDL